MWKLYCRKIVEVSDYLRQINKPFQAIYMGGGTPTALSDQGFAKVMTAIKERIPQTKNCEITIEAGRPDSITPAKFTAIKELSETRICINPQTMHDRTLRTIGRDHSVENVYRHINSHELINFHQLTWI